MGVSRMSSNIGIGSEGVYLVTSSFSACSREWAKTVDTVVESGDITLNKNVFIVFPRDLEDERVHGIYPTFIESIVDTMWSSNLHNQRLVVQAVEVFVTQDDAKSVRVLRDSHPARP